MKVFAEGVESYVTDASNANPAADLIPNLSCDTDGESGGGASRRRYGGGGGESSEQESSWKMGETFHK